MKFQVKVVHLAVALLIALMTVGCQEILDDALTSEVTINENIVSDQNVTGSGQTVNVIPGTTALSKAAGDLAKAMGFQVFTVTPPNATVFSELAVQGVIKLVGNGDAHGSTGTLTVVLGTTSTLTDPMTQGTVVASYGLSGQTTFSIALTPSMSAFFTSNPSISPFYVYLVLSSGSPSITLNNLDFLIPPAAEIVKVIAPTGDLVDIAEVQDVIDSDIGGSVTNNGSGSVTMLIMLSDMTTTVLTWEGTIVNETIPAGSTLNLGDVAFDSDQLSSALEFLAGGSSVEVRILLSSTADINVDIASIDILGTAEVTLE